MHIVVLAGALVGTVSNDSGKIGAKETATMKRVTSAVA
jgi:hypothetical protein